MPSSTEASAAKRRKVPTIMLANLVKNRHTALMAFAPGWLSSTPTILADECHLCYVSVCGFAALGYTDWIELNRSAVVLIVFSPSGGS